jgi:hypothetical protein
MLAMAFVRALANRTCSNRGATLFCPLVTLGKPDMKVCNTGHTHVAHGLPLPVQLSPEVNNHTDSHRPPRKGLGDSA